MKKLLFLSFLLFFLNIFGENIKLIINYLGIPAVKVNITISDTLLNVRAKSTTLTNMVAKMDNYYEIKYNSDFLLPIYYKKNINQKEYFENRITLYNRKNLLASRTDYLKKNIVNYKIMKESRDFFSSLMFLRKINGEKQRTIFLDANKLIWQANLILLKTEKLKTNIGKILCNKYEIRFKKISKRKKERSDMLTNNLVNEKGILYFWITNDGRNIPVLAKYSRKPFPVYWKIQSYEK